MTRVDDMLVESKIELSMRLDVGVKAPDILIAAKAISTALELTLDSRDDGELGGAYFAYEPRPLPEAGIVGARVHANDVPGIGRWVPHRRDVPFVARIEVSSSDLLSLGRLAARIGSRAGEMASPVGYTVVGGQELWRAHKVLFTSDVAAARRWKSSGTLFEDVRSDEARPANLLLCHLTLGVRAQGLDEARRAAEAAFSVELKADDDPEMGGVYFACDLPALSAIVPPGIVVRANALDSWSWLFPHRKDLPFLFGVTLWTQDLLEVGRIAADVEATLGAAVQVLEYRAIGDLVCDRVPRALLGQFR